MKSCVAQFGFRMTTQFLEVDAEGRVSDPGMAV